MKHFTRLVLLLSAVLAGSGQGSIPIEQAKGLWGVVIEDYKHCSPFQGMVIWYSNILENIYRLNKDDATTKLVRMLFKLHEDGTFDCTRPPVNPVGAGNSAAYFTPDIIADIISWLEHAQTAAEVEQLQKRITSKEYVTKFIKEHATFPKEGNFLKNLQKLFTIICQSYVQCLLSASYAIYMPYTTHTILLGFMWKKFSTKLDFMDYFNGLKIAEYPLSITHQVNQNRFIQEAYSIDELRNTFAELSTWPSNRLLTEMDYERAVCALLLPRTPKRRELLQPIPQEKEVQYQGEEFSDCGEAVLLSFFNMLLFDVQTGQFNTHFIVEAGNPADPKLEEFYQKYPTIESMQSKQVHHDWAKVVSAIQGVRYRQPAEKPEQERFCNIAGGSSQQLLLILKHLLGVNSFDELVHNYSRTEFVLTYISQQLPETEVLTFAINNQPAFALVVDEHHFSFQRLSSFISFAGLTGAQIDALVALMYTQSFDWPGMIKISGLLAIMQSLKPVQLFIEQVPSRKLTFSTLIPRLKDPAVNREFITLLCAAYERTAPNAAYIADLIKHAYALLAYDLASLQFIASNIVDHKVEKLYGFMQDEMARYAKDQRYAITVRRGLALTLAKKIVTGRITALYDWVSSLFDAEPNLRMFKLNFIEFLVAPGSTLNKAEREMWFDLIRKRFSAISIAVQREICQMLIQYKASDWYPLIIQHLASFDWDRYWQSNLSQLRGVNRYLDPQEAFAALFDAADSDADIARWLVSKINYMNDANHQRMAVSQ